MSNGYARYRKQNGNGNGEALKPGDIVYTAGELADTVIRPPECEASILEELICIDEGRVTEVLEGGKRAKINFGLEDEMICTLAYDLRQEIEKLKPGTKVRGSKAQNMVFVMADENKGPEQIQEAEQILKFGGYPGFHKQLEQWIINPMSRFEDYAGHFSVFLVIAGPSGLGKSHSLLYSAQKISQNLGFKIDLIMPSPSDLRQMYFGASESAANELFNRAIASASKGIPALIVLDEAENVLRDRQENRVSSVRSTLDALVGVFLSRITQLKSQHSDLPICVAATSNFALSDMDHAVLNDHRLSAMILLDYPNGVSEVDELISCYVDDREMAGRLSDKIMNARLVEVTTSTGEKRDIELGEMTSPAIISAIAGDVVVLTREESFANGGAPVTASWEHYSEAAEQRIQGFARRLENVRAAREYMSPRILADLDGSIVSVKSIYEPGL